jgi:hypothetical protein
MCSCPYCLHCRSQSVPYPSKWIDYHGTITSHQAGPDFQPLSEFAAKRIKQLESYTENLHNEQSSSPPSSATRASAATPATSGPVQAPTLPPDATIAHTSVLSATSGSDMNTNDRKYIIALRHPGELPRFFVGRFCPAATFKKSARRFGSHEEADTVLSTCNQRWRDEATIELIEDAEVSVRGRIQVARQKG